MIINRTPPMNYTYKPKEQIGFGHSSEQLAEKVGEFFKNPEIFRPFECRGKDLSMLVAGIFAFGIILGARLIQARDKDERREVATRDFSAVTTILFALPVLKRITATGLRKVTGFSMAHGRDFIRDHFRIEKGLQPREFQDVKDLYSGIKHFKNGLIDFIQVIDKNKGNLSKIFLFLDDNAKKALNAIAKSTTGTETAKPVTGFISKIAKHKTGSKISLDIPADNVSVIKMLEKAKNTPALNKHYETVEKALHKKNNEVFKFAEFLTSVPEIINIGIIAGFLGWFLPWFNIKHTKDIYSKNNNAAVQKPQPCQYQQFPNRFDQLKFR